MEAAFSRLYVKLGPLRLDSPVVHQGVGRWQAGTGAEEDRQKEGGFGLKKSQVPGQVALHGKSIATRRGER
jgi:hypothetical protein